VDSGLPRRSNINERGKNPELARPAGRHKGRVKTSNKKKANIFAQHYAAVSKLNFTPKERVITRRLKKILGSLTANNLSCIQFSLEELEAAIHKMRRKEAAGPDDIPPTFLKALGPLAKKNS